MNGAFLPPFFVQDLIERERERERQHFVWECVFVCEREKERDVSQSGYKKKSLKKMSPKKGKTRQKAYKC